MWQPSASPFSRNRQVRFDDAVSIRIVKGDDSFAQCVAHIDQLEQLTRTMWHMDGQCATEEAMFSIVQSWPHQHGVAFSRNRVQQDFGCGLASCCCSRDRPRAFADSLDQMSANFETDWTDFLDLYHQWSRPIGYVEVCFLDHLRLPLCIRPRRLRLGARLHPMQFIAVQLTYTWFARRHLLFGTPWRTSS